MLDLCHSHEPVLPFALLKRPLDDGRESPEEGVLLGLGLRPGALHAGVLLCELHRLREAWSQISEETERKSEL